MTSLERRDDAPAATRTLGGVVGAVVGALVAFPLLLAGIEPMGLAVPVGLILGYLLAPSAAKDPRFPIATTAAMAMLAVVLGDAFVVLTLGASDAGAAASGFVLGLVFFGVPALVPASIAAVVWAVVMRWLRRRSP